MRLLPYGDAALLVEVDDLASVLHLLATLDSDRPPGVLDLVPGARTLLIRHEPDADRRALAQAVEGAPGRSQPHRRGRADHPVEIDVRYVGDDLDEVGELTGLGARGVVEWHTGADWTVAFAGFAPGFGYLVRAQDALAVPRRASPRTSVPAGAVGLAGEYSGVYPRSSPGGWQVIGHTDEVLWDLERDPPARLAPGARVRFRAVP